MVQDKPASPPPSLQINLAASPAAAQLINRAQSVNSATASGIAQQAVLLGNTAAPALTASQAQMYLRAQMVSPQLGTAGTRAETWAPKDQRRAEKKHRGRKCGEQIK